jgi:hypothetical protein
MQAQEMMKQMIDFQKKTFDTIISVTGRYQDQTNNSTKLMMDRTSYWPLKGIKSYKAWLAATRQCMEDFKPVTNQWFQSWRQIIDAQQSPASPSNTNNEEGT